MRIAELASKFVESAKVIIGVPSYRLYCEHMRQHHPERPIMGEAEFFRNRQDARYGRGSGGRCC